MNLFLHDCQNERPLGTILPFPSPLSDAEARRLRDRGQLWLRFRIVAAAFATVAVLWLLVSFLFAVTP